jgi:hypothetical protein
MWNQRETPGCGTQVPLSEQKRLARDRDLEAQSETMARASDEAILAELFRYQPPNETTVPKYQAVNQAAKNFAEVVLQNCPPSADRSDAIRKIREARMTANAAIALNGLSL